MWLSTAPHGFGRSLPSPQGRMPRSGQTIKKQAQAVQRHDHHVVQTQTRQRLQLRTGPLHACGHEAFFNWQDPIGIGVAANAPEQTLGLQACAMAGRAFGVAAVLGQEHTDVHLVGLALQVLKKALHAVPLVVPAPLPLGRTVDHPVLLRLGQPVPGCVSRNACGLGMPHQIVLVFLPGGRLQRLDGPGPQREFGVRNDQAVIDADHPAKTPAGFARAHRRVEGEHRRDRVGVALVAVGAMQAGGKTPDVEARLGGGGQIGI